MTYKKANRVRIRTPKRKCLTTTLELKALATWANTLKGCLRFLTQLKKVKGGEGAQWAAGNRRYYLKRTHQLLDNVPKGAEVVASKARKLLAELE